MTMKYSTTTQQNLPFKIVCFYTESQLSLLTDYFLPSIQDDVDVHVVKLKNQIMNQNLSNFGSKEYVGCLLNKLQYYTEFIKSSYGEIILILDIDIVLIDKLQSTINSKMDKLDICWQKGWPICGGVVCVNCNERTYNFFNTVKTKFEQLISRGIFPSSGEQELTNELLLERHSDSRDFFKDYNSYHTKYNIQWGTFDADICDTWQLKIKNNNDIFDFNLNKEVILSQPHKIKELFPSMKLYHAGDTCNTENKSSIDQKKEQLDIIIDIYNLSLDSIDCNVISKNKKELIVSKYKEDISWINEIDCNYVVYDKSDDAYPNSLTLKNVGRESHTYIRYIVDHYNILPDICVFSQGNPNDHESKFTEKVNSITSDNITKYTGFGKTRDTLHIHSDGHIGSLFGNYYEYKPTKYFTYSNLTFSDFCKKVIGFDVLSEFGYYEYICGGQFSVTKSQILKHPKSFYVKLLSYLDYSRDPEEGHYMERLWGIIFNENVEFNYNNNDICYGVLACKKNANKCDIQRKTWAVNEEHITFFSEHDDDYFTKINDDSSYTGAIEKTYLGLKWLYENKPNYKWYMFCDDDTYIFKSSLLKFIHQLSEDEICLYGKIIHVESPEELQSKYKDKVPCPHGGAGFLMNRKTLEKIVHGIDNGFVKHKKHGDITVGFICAEYDIPLQHNSKFHAWTPEQERMKFSSDLKHEISFHKFYLENEGMKCLYNIEKNYKIDKRELTNTYKLYSMRSTRLSTTKILSNTCVLLHGNANDDMNNLLSFYNKVTNTDVFYSPSNAVIEDQFIDCCKIINSSCKLKTHHLLTDSYMNQEILKKYKNIIILSTDKQINQKNLLLLENLITTQNKLISNRTINSNVDSNCFGMKTKKYLSLVNSSIKCIENRWKDFYKNKTLSEFITLSYLRQCEHENNISKLKTPKVLNKNIKFVDV